MSSTPLPTFTLLVPDGLQPNPLDANAVAISLSVGIVTVLSCAALILQQRKKKRVFLRDRDHPTDRGPRCEEDAIELDDQTAKQPHHRIASPTSEAVTSSDPNSFYTADKHFSEQPSSATYEKYSSEPEEYFHTLAYGGQRAPSYEGLRAPRPLSEATANLGYGEMRNDLPRNPPLGSEYDGSYVASEWERDPNPIGDDAY